MNDFLNDIVSQQAGRPMKQFIPDPATDPKLTAEERNVARDILETAIEVAKKEDLNPSNFSAPGTLARQRERIIMDAAFKNFESAAGGRRSLHSTLQHCPEISHGSKAAQRLLADRDFNTEKKFGLFAIASRHKIPLSALVVAFRDAKMAELAVQSLCSMAEAAPEVVEQIAQDAKSGFIKCHVCEGKTRVRMIGDNGEWRMNEQGELLTQLCYQCRGSGKIFKEHDPQSRTHFLKITGILEDRKVPLIDQSTKNILSMDFKPGNGDFEKLIKAVDAVTGTAQKKEDTIDVPFTVYDSEESENSQNPA